MPRTAEHNEALRAATLKAVQTAAVRVFARHGFAATTMRAIAAQAGLSIGSIYRHYPTKHELFNELLDQAAAGLVAAAAQLDGTGSPVDVVREFTAGYLSDIASNDAAGEFFIVINQGFTTDTPAGTAARLLDSHRALWRSFSALVRRGQELGQFADGDPDRLTAGYFAMLSGIATMRVALQDELPMPGIDLVLRVLTGREVND